MPAEVGPNVATEEGLQEVRLANFRCFRSAELAPASSVNFIVGDNASGKTSLLEALFFLGRGSSFRAARAEAAIRDGQSALTIFGRMGGLGSQGRFGIEISRDEGLAIRIDGSAGTRAELALAVPVQILDPASHELIQGPPSERRRFLDWGVFHVEQSFFGVWQRYRRAILQRNAALRAQLSEAAWAWDGALVEAGLEIDRQRRLVIGALAPVVLALAAELLEQDVELTYLKGWAENDSLESALVAARHRDLVTGSTQVGPHRADLRISIRERRVKDAVSRGQEKLLAAALTLAQVQIVRKARHGPVILLIDEPGADLDRTHVGRLGHTVSSIDAQVFITALTLGGFDVPSTGRTFHVERGQVRHLL